MKVNLCTAPRTSEPAYFRCSLALCFLQRRKCRARAAAPRGKGLRCQHIYCRLSFYAKSVSCRRISRYHSRCTGYSRPFFHRLSGHAKGSTHPWRRRSYHALCGLGCGLGASPARFIRRPDDLAARRMNWRMESGSMIFNECQIAITANPGTLKERVQ